MEELATLDICYGPAMENRYGVSPMTMLQLLEPMIFIVPILLWLLVIGPLLIYPIARWKTAQDSQLGLKVALHYFKLLAFHLLLLGAFVILYTIIRKGGGKGDTYRSGFGLLVPAAIVFGAHVALLKRTTDEVAVTVRRLFMGYNLILVGLLGMTALVFGFQALFARGSAGDDGRLYLAAVLVYVTAWAACGARFAILVGADFASAPPEHVAPPGPPPPPATPGLPSLGGGNYPPLSQ